MGARGIIGTHPHWGVFASAAVLPNAAGGENVGTRLLVGDQAYATSEAGTYTCTDATPGAAVWAAGGGISGVVMSIETGRYDYSSPAGAGPEEVVGQFMFDASKAPGTVKMRCMMNPTLTSGDQVEVHVDDIGVPGTPAAPTRVTNTTTHGLVIAAASAQQDYKETSAFTLTGGPSPGVLVAGPRMYEVIITITGGNGAGTVDLGFAGLYVEV